MRLILVEVDDGLAIVVGPGMVIRRSGLRQDQCTIFTPGQATTEGFLVDRNYEDVVREVDEALAGANRAAEEKESNTEEEH